MTLFNSVLVVADPTRPAPAKSEFEVGEVLIPDDSSRVCESIAIGEHMQHYSRLKTISGL